MFITGILVFMAGLFCLALLGANFYLNRVWIFIDWPTAFGFILVIASVIISTGSFKIFVVAINALLSKKYSISAAHKEKAVRLFKLLGKSVTCASIVLTVLGIMLTLTDLSDLTTLGASVSVTLCAIIYGALINLLLINPAVNILETRYNTEEKAVISEKQVIDKLLELCYRQGVSPEEILAADEINFIKYGQ